CNAQLADRVDGRQQSAARLGDGKDTKDSKDSKDTKEPSDAARQAARDLASQKLAERMRAGAQARRGGKDTKGTKDTKDTKGTKTAPAEQQLADALDKIARQMNRAEAGGGRGETARPDTRCT